MGNETPTGRFGHGTPVRWRAALFAGAALALLGAAPANEGRIEIPFERIALPNGLTVLLHEDHAQPVVVVNVSFRVGSRFEAQRRSGFAHLFEHLMFMGTRRAPPKAFDEWLEGVGASSNAFTSEDRTSYYETGPSSALELMLWLDADRMRDLGPLMTDEKLEAQREVVRNERRESYENRPYGRVELELPELLYPPDHPYHHAVIGSHDDLEAATVADVKEFFATYYDPANATLLIGGDFDPAATRATVQRLFAGIPSRGRAPDPGAPGFSDTKTTLTAAVRKTVEDEVQDPAVFFAWQAPRHFAPGDAELDLLADALAGGKASRLYRALVYEQELAQEVAAFNDSRDLGSVFRIQIIARPGVPLERIEEVVQRELAAVRKTPIEPAEFERALNQIESAFVRRVESLGSRVFTLAQYQDTLGDPGYAAKDLERYRSATPEGIRDVAARFLVPEASVTVRVLPKSKPVEGAAGEKAGATGQGGQR